jgi:methyl-accepting chemotaxis protein
MRVTVKWKIFIGTLVLALSIVIVDVLYTNRMLEQAASRQGELSTTYGRYLRYQESISKGYAAAIDAWAISSQKLHDALLKGDDEAARPQIEAVEGALQEDLKPTFVVVVDKHGDPTFSPGAPFSVDDVHSMRLFADLRHRGKVQDKLLNHNGRSYVVNGVPILDGGNNVGSIVIGKDLSQIFSDFKAQSDNDPRKQVELALVSNQSQCIASSAKQDDWDDIQRAALKSPRDTDRDGTDRVEVLKWNDALHDFFAALQNGYDGTLAGTVGTIYVMRNRADHAERMQKLIKDNLLVAAVAILFGALAAFAIAIGITRPLKKLIVATEEIAQGRGDLTKRISLHSSDEIGDLAGNLNSVFENLHHLASGVQSASLSVGSSSAEISAASKQMLAGAKEQAVKIESSTAAVTELSSSIQQVANNALQATKVAKESGDQVQTAIDGMARIRSTVEDAAEKIHELGESGKRIGNIVEVIRQISEQTTLLALNASIEAAHAGEQGRGFAVVANEVSSLAKRVGQSAKDIEDLIATIKDQTSEAVTSMQTGTRDVEDGTQIVTHTLGSLKTIVEVIQDTANAVQEQAVVSDEIARNMDAVQKIAQEVLASSEEAVIQGETLHELAHGLEESVRNFRLEEGRDDKKLAVVPADKALPPAERRRAARG